jgi:hypothetical protein
VTLSVGVTAMGPALSVHVAGQNGVPPYTYSIVPNGAGGSIAPVGGGSDEALYTSPAVVPIDPAKQSVTLRVEDSDGDFATASILIGDALLLFCEIIQRELGLADGRVYIYNQKIFQPQDAGLYVAVGVLNAKPFGNTNKAVAGAGMESQQSVNMAAVLSLDIISRDTSALRLKEQVIMALNSTYANKQQQANSFFIGQLPAGGAIPYRFNISVNIQYFTRKIQAIEYFNDFENVEVTTES